MEVHMNNQNDYICDEPKPAGYILSPEENAKLIERQMAYERSFKYKFKKCLGFIGGSIYAIIFLMLCLSMIYKIFSI